MIFTSPPFPLNTKKKYGNLTGRRYIRWLTGFARLFADLLKPDGSIVLEMGNGWEEGQPTMSTLPLEALLAFKRAGRFHLCQEFICFNPARLPSPAQWVNVERCRVKDAFTRLWWLSRTPRPKANNRNVLTSYSQSMRRLLEKGTYNPGPRPSEFVIGETSFLKNNSGAISPNVLSVSIAETITELSSQPLNVFSLANTSSSDSYQNYCRGAGVTPHPARMPSKLVEFFVQFLTDSNDLVVDPFAGSNISGAAAERLGRRWKSIEIEQGYVRASMARFEYLKLVQRPSVDVATEAAARGAPAVTQAARMGYSA
jgi:site-specific DNA-methyltransferase (cytosine-N4-specific)